MEENKEKKINILKILLIIAILIIIIMSFFMYKLIKERNIKTDNMMGNSDNKIGTDLLNEKEEKIKQFLTSGKVIST